MSIYGSLLSPVLLFALPVIENASSMLPDNESEAADPLATER
jgi:hypothetical protein